MEKDWFVLLSLVLALLIAATYGQWKQGAATEQQIAQLREIADRLKPVGRLNESLTSIANELKVMSTDPPPQADVKNALKEQLVGARLSPEQMDGLIDDVLKEFRAQLESASGEVRRDLGAEILGPTPSVPSPQLVEKVKPLWEAAVRKAVDASTIPGNVKREAVDRLLKYADKAVETLISELIKSGMAWAKGLISPEKGKERDKIEVHVTCPGTCPPPTPAPPPTSPPKLGSFIIPFRSGTFSLREQNQVQELWRARNHYNERLAIRSGYGLTLRGYTDTTGDERRNVRLRAARAYAVACELIRLGVPRTALRVDSSQAKPPIPVSGKVAIPMNRTVVVEEGALDSGEPVQQCLAG